MRAATTDTRPALAPPLKWAGGKRWQVPLLQPLWARIAAAGWSSRSAAAWRSRSASSPTGAAQRSQSACHQFLSLAAARPDDRPADAQRAGDVLPAPRALQRPRRRGRGRHGRSGVALLLPESHGLQRPVPVQPAGRIQRAVRPLRSRSGTRATSRRTRRRWRAGSSGTATSNPCRSRPATSSTPTRRTTCRSLRTRPAGSAGTIRNAPPPGWPDIRARSCSSIRPHHGLCGCTRHLGSDCAGAGCTATHQLHRRSTARAGSAGDKESLMRAGGTLVARV